MIVDLGTVTPGSTLRVTFDSYSGTDGSSITMTDFAVSDILIYKDGSTTERASTSGYTATTDFDSKTGKQLVAIDLADNTTAGFYAAGSEYLVAIDTVTIDGAATGGWLARFRIGYEGSTLNTTIASLSSQTSFTLTNGPAEDDALNGRWAIIHDVASSVQCTWVQIIDYTGSTKTVTLAAAGTYTAAATDNFSLMGPMPIQATIIGRTLDVTATGVAGIDWGNVENPTTTVTLSGTTVKTATDVETDTADIQARLPAALVSGRMDASVGAMESNVMTAAAAAADLTTEIQSGLATAASLATAQADLDILTGADGAIIASGTQTFNMTGNLSGSVGSVTGNVGGNVTGSVGSVATGGISAASFAAGAIDSAAIAADAIGSSELAATATAEIASAVRTELTTELARVDVAISTRLATAGYTAPLDAAGTRTAVGLASANLDTQLAALPTAGENADAVWEEAIADHSGTAGGTAEALNAAGAAGDPWTTALPGAYGSGSAGNIIGNRIDAAISTRATPAQVNSEADAALADVGLTTTITGRIDAAISTRLESASYSAPPSAATIASQVRTELTTELGRIDAAISTRLASAGYTVPLDAAGTRSALGLASANLDTQLAALDTLLDTAIANIAALNNISTSQVLTQVNTALDTAISELGVAAPTATPTLRTGLMLLYMALRNRTTTTATTQTIQNNAGSTITSATLSDDGTTFTKAEFG